MPGEKDNGNVSSKKLKHSLREYIWESVILRKVFSNPFIVSIFILAIIWLLDIMYGKSFACADRKEIIQHILTTYIVVSIGIVLNNLTLKNKYKKDCKTCIQGANDRPMQSFENQMQSYDRPIQSHDRPMQSYDRPMQSFEKQPGNEYHEKQPVNEYPGMNQIISEYTE